MWEGWVKIVDMVVREGLSDDLCEDLKDLGEERRCAFCLDHFVGRLRTSLIRWVFCLFFMKHLAFQRNPYSLASAFGQSLHLCTGLHFPHLLDMLLPISMELTFLWAQVETCFRVFLLSKQTNKQ